MIGHKIGSWEAALAIRAAEKIVMERAQEAHEDSALSKVGRPLGRWLLAVGFLTLCFLPALTVLALVVTAIFLAR